MIGPVVSLAWWQQRRDQVVLADVRWYLDGRSGRAPRPGHIPGARSLPCRENLAADGTFLPADQLRERLAGVGVTDAAQVVSYCGSGVTACHNLLVLEYADLGQGRLYPGSWSQYSHTTRPAALGDDAVKH